MSNKKDTPAIADSDCLAAMDYLYAYLNDELDDQPETCAMIEHHLGHCRSCLSRAEMERVMNDRLKKSGKEKTPQSLKKRLRNLMRDF